MLNYIQVKYTFKSIICAPVTSGRMKLSLIIIDNNILRKSSRMFGKQFLIVEIIVHVRKRTHVLTVLGQFPSQITFYIHVTKYMRRFEI
jgi:hypothetical protein